jgi:hypothetical protein
VAHLELRYKGLYNGSLDGVIGPETMRALGRFEENDGLHRTITLDPQTMYALTDSPGIGEGSNPPPNTEGAGSMATSSGTSDFMLRLARGAFLEISSVIRSRSSTAFTTRVYPGVAV